VGQADELPFCFDVIETTEKELAEPSRSLDLAKDGLNGFFSFRIGFPPLPGPKESFHPFLDREMLRDSAARS